LDYPGIGPEHSYLSDIGRAEYYAVTDAEALEAFQHVSRLEGIIPALETSHAFAYLKVSVAVQSHPAHQCSNAPGLAQQCKSGVTNKVSPFWGKSSEKKPRVATVGSAAPAIGKPRAS